jgi:mercuric ion transport protein
MKHGSHRRVFGLSLSAILPAAGVSLSWFCCLPIAVGALGGGAATVGVALAPLRSYLTTLAMTLLGVAFYQAYKPRKAGCSPGEACAVERHRTWQRVMLWLVALITLALLTAGEWTSWITYWTL